MNTGLVAMVILTSWAQVRREERRLPEPPVRQSASINVRVGQDIRQIAVSWSAPLARADEDDDQPGPLVWAFNIKTAVVDPENFDLWLFGEQPGEERTRHLEEILLASVANAAREHGLHKAQKAKLLLAGRGDIKRFFDEVENRRKDFEIERKTITRGSAALRGLEPLSQVYRQGPFKDGSLFAKTLWKMNEDRKADRLRRS
jgi:hypothetical protein